MFKKYWNVWLTITIITIVFIIKKNNAILVEEVRTTLMFVVSLFGTLTVMKTNIEGKKTPKVFSENNIECIKNEMGKVMIDLTDELNLNQTFELLKEKKKMKKMKSFFAWLWGNKYTLINLTMSVVAVGLCNYLMFFGYLDKYAIFNENETLAKILGVSISVIYLIVDVFTTVSKYGCESLDQLNKRYQEEAEKKLNALTSEQKTAVKSTIKKLQNQLEIIEPKYNEAIKNIENYEMLSKIKGFDTTTLYESYNLALQFKNENALAVQELKRQIEVLSSKLK